jgi:hypothetical protein
MFVPSNAIPTGLVPTVNVPSVAPAGDSSTTSLPALMTHRFVPSNAIPPDPVAAGKVPRGPHAGGFVGWHGALLQSPSASGARQSRVTGGQSLQGPIAQSLSFVQVAPPPVPPEELVVPLPPVPPEELVLVVALPLEELMALPPVPPEELVLVVALPPVPPEELAVLSLVPLEELAVALPLVEAGSPGPPHDAATSTPTAIAYAGSGEPLRMFRSS